MRAHELCRKGTLLRWGGVKLNAVCSAHSNCLCCVLSHALNGMLLEQIGICVLSLSLSSTHTYPYPLSLCTRASWRYSSLGCNLAAPRLLSILILILPSTTLFPLSLDVLVSNLFPKVCLIEDNVGHRPQEHFLSQ